MKIRNKDLHLNYKHSDLIKIKNFHIKNKTYSNCQWQLFIMISFPFFYLVLVHSLINEIHINNLFIKNEILSIMTDINLNILYSNW